MFSALVLALLATAPAQDTARGVIRGTVQSEPSGLPIPLAVVEAQGRRRTMVGMTDSAGNYLLRVESGNQVFRVRHLEHAPIEMQVLVPAAGEVVLDVALQHRPITLAPVRVEEPRPDSVAASAVEVGLVIGHHTLDEGGTGLGGLGGMESESGGEALYVRGSASNLQLVLLDGAPVYAPFHMGGLIESFEPGAVASARLFLGGAPAQYDGGLSYVMDLTTRAGNRERHSISGGADMLSARAVVDGPLPSGARYLAYARTLHGYSLSRLEGQPFPYRFADGMVRLDAPVAGGALAFTAFGNREGVRLDTMRTDDDAFARWANQAGSLRWRGRIDGSDAEFTVAGGRFRGTVPLRDTTSRAFLLNTVQNRLRLGADFGRRAGPLRLRYGVGLDRTWLRHHASEPAAFRTLVKARSTGTATGAYLDATWQPSARVVLRGGVRGDGYSRGGLFTLAPRASAAWLVTDRATLTVAAGRYHQYVLTPRPLGAGVEPRNYADSARIPVALAVAGGSHLVLVLDQELLAGVRLGLEGFYKHFNGLPLPGTRGAHNSGVDVWVRRSAGDVTGWLGYSLGWAWNTLDSASAPTPFHGRQTLSAGVTGSVLRHTRVALRMAYGEGLAYTSGGPGGADAITGGSSLGGTPSDPVNLDTNAPLGGQGGGPFVRLDAELSRTFAPRVAGRIATLTPYLRVINALESRDALIYRYFGQNQEAGTLQSVATLPLVPVLGVNFRF
ncbi:TonB-dependent receptor [Longimicrobium terrae]|uniref:TonB-dependent receptor plug domain-containing protein n=1 Tax=Longimicrobium terrae TaxID=1639882 RepID=A0A841GZK8_9BACT|nr:TonB-dependent receptor plug domain-containing protein [Longimicrobium terrae]MBB4636808.1 hypothetical protein [Longimicrobium terrae]MBB6071193.1 hypothetical protein [Longimicrobium terrae]NNC29241.1 TonB-dependent receptor plug domain-containing protein [Longimicrobium terrae]